MIEQDAGFLKEGIPECFPRRSWRWRSRSSTWERDATSAQPDARDSATDTARGNWDTRVGTVELKVPRVRDWSYFPSLLEPRRRAERAALSAVVQEAYYVHGISTRKEWTTW